MSDSPAAPRQNPFFQRDFLQEVDFTPQEFRALLDLAAHLKAEKKAGTEQQYLRGKSVALIFEKTSTRTRCAFEVAAFDQGAGTTYLDPTSSQIGHKESIADTARVLARFYDGIEFRGSAHSTVMELAAASDVPVFNGLTNDWHPTQALADSLTMREHSAKPLEELSIAYLGDARFNMGNSILLLSAQLGIDVRIAAPESLWNAPAMRATAQSIADETGAKLTFTTDISEAVAGVDFIHTDVWVSMGEPADVWQERIKLLHPYQVNAAVMAATGNPDTKFMHCLPAFHNQETQVARDIYAATGLRELEVTDEVFSSPASVVFDQAENRLHTIKAVMVATMAPDAPVRY